MANDESPMLCPVCLRPMDEEVRRTPSKETLIFQCKHCGISTTRTVERPDHERA